VLKKKENFKITQVGVSFTEEKYLNFRAQNSFKVYKTEQISLI